jgi:hypothetical protein
MEGSVLEIRLLGAAIVVNEERRLPTVDVGFERELCTIDGKSFSILDIMQISLDTRVQEYNIPSW